jgi:hypothetical protein
MSGIRLSGTGLLRESFHVGKGIWEMGSMTEDR